MVVKRLNEPRSASQRAFRRRPFMDIEAGERREPK